MQIHILYDKIDLVSQPKAACITLRNTRMYYRIEM